MYIDILGDFKYYPYWDFPGGPGVKNLPSIAGKLGSILGQGTKIPHAVGQLSPCSITTEPMEHNEDSE